MACDLIAYFGYGSLVNIRTLHEGHVGAVPARLNGWRRHWQSRGRDIAPGTALLSAHRHEPSAIDGLLIVDRRDNLPALDLREARYERVRLSPGDLAIHQGRAHGGGAAPADLAALGGLPAEIFVYVGLAQPKEERDPPLLQSYLDTVMLGFLDHYGEGGVEGFIASTTGFGRAMLLDRDIPIYPRAQRGADQHHRWFDGLLAEAGVRFGLEDHMEDHMEGRAGLP